MRTVTLALGILALSAVSTLAKADNIVNFTVSGTGIIMDGPFNGSAPYSLPNGVASGTFSYDFTNNTVLDNMVSLTNGTYNISDDLDLAALVPGTPVGSCDPGLDYTCQTGTLDPTGGSFYLEYDLDFHNGDRIGQVYTGDITPNVTPNITPEPSSIALFGTGILGLAGTLRRRSCFGHRRSA